MGFLIRRHLRLSKWLSLNLSKSGVGLSLGRPGAKLSVNPKRARVQLGIPGTGIGYRRDVSLSQQQEPTSPTRRHSGVWVLVGLVLLGLLVVFLFSGCAAQTWPDQSVRSVSTPPQTIELFNADGRHVGYGKVQGGTVDLFNADSSRAGHGRK